MDGLLIEVLGLRGCGRRQVPTCACRINLQLHSRPLSPTLTVAVAVDPFLFATSCSHIHLVLSPFYAPFLPSSHVSAFLSLRNPSLRLLYLLTLCLSVPHPSPLLSLFFPSTSHPPSFHFLISVRGSLAFLLIKIPFLLTSLSLSVLPQYTFIIFARSARNYIIVPLMILAHLCRTKKPIDSYNSFTTHFTAFPL